MISAREAFEISIKFKQVPSNKINNEIVLFCIEKIKRDIITATNRGKYVTEFNILDYKQYLCLYDKEKLVYTVIPTEETVEYLENICDILQKYGYIVNLKHDIVVHKSEIFWDRTQPTRNLPTLVIRWDTVEFAPLRKFRAVVRIIIFMNRWRKEYYSPSGMGFIRAQSNFINCSETKRMKIS
jgi:hypothetical protein